jgi:hypothetical protein
VVHAAAWYLQRHDIYLIGTGETGYGLSYPDAAGRLLDPVHFVVLMTQRSSHQPVLTVCHRDCDGRYVKLLPKAARKQTWASLPSGSILDSNNVLQPVLHRFCDGNP